MIRNDQAYLEHILEAISKIENFTTAISRIEFERDVMMQDAVIRNIEIIGEATKRSPKSSPNHILKFPGTTWLV